MNVLLTTDARPPAVEAVPPLALLFEGALAVGLLVAFVVAVGLAGDPDEGSAARLPLALRVMVGALLFGGAGVVAGLAIPDAGAEVALAVAAGAAVAGDCALDRLLGRHPPLAASVAIPRAELVGGVG